jgi:hypothetical protein
MGSFASAFVIGIAGAKLLSELACVDALSFAVWQ